MMHVFYGIAGVVWWSIRGVGPHEYREVCERCGYTGQAHWSPIGCRRFKRKA